MNCGLESLDDKKVVLEEDREEKGSVSMETAGIQTSVASADREPIEVTGPTEEGPISFRADPRTIQALMQERQVTKEQIFQLLCSGYIDPNVPVRPSASPIDTQLR